MLDLQNQFRFVLNEMKLLDKDQQTKLYAAIKGEQGKGILLIIGFHHF